MVVTEVGSRLVVRLFGARRPPCLLAQAQEDPDAFAAFYDAYAERVLVFLTRRVLDVDMAFDLLSETFATALERRRQFRGGTRRGGAGLAVLDRALRAVALLAPRPRRAHRAGARSGVPVPGLSDPEIERIEELAGHRAGSPAARGGDARRCPRTSAAPSSCAWSTNAATRTSRAGSA